MIRLSYEDSLPKIKGTPELIDMTSLVHNRMNLNEAGLEMFRLCELQLRSTKKAFYKRDPDLAEEVIHLEKRINALDLEIDRECERFLALHQPVAQDLRFVLGLRKINFSLERIGDYCYGISKYTSEMQELPKEKILSKLRMNLMFINTLSMMEKILEAYEQGDSTEIKNIFFKQQVLDKIYRKSFSIVSREVRKDVTFCDQYLLFFTLIEKLNGIGSLIANIAEEIIFYNEAEVWRHQKETFEWD